MKTAAISSILQDNFHKYVSYNRHDQSHISSWVATPNFKNEYLMTLGTGSFMWNYKIHKLIITVTEEGSPIATDPPSYFTRITITHDDMEVIESFLQDIVKFEEETEKGMITIYSGKSRMGYWEKSNALSVQPLHRVYIDDEMKTSLVNHIDSFYAMEKRYNEFGRTHKLNILLTGVPGSGKTSLVKAISLKYNMKLFVLSLSKEITDDTLSGLFNAAKSRCIFLLEDVDAFFVDRESKNNNVSFSALLNLMDGTLSKNNGSMFFLTANNPDRLDSALIRPGRIDRIVKFDFPKKREIRAAFFDLVQNATDEIFNEFYGQTKQFTVSMSTYIDYLFRYPESYMDHIDEFEQEYEIRKSITSDSGKLYT